MTHPCIVHNEETTEYYFVERCYITEWWNSPHDYAVSIARACLKPGITTRLHRLIGITERYVIISGKGRVEVGDIHPEIVNPGDVVVIPSLVTQRITNIGDTDLVFLAICTPRFTHNAYEDIENCDVTVVTD